MEKTKQTLVRLRHALLLFALLTTVLPLLAQRKSDRVLLLEKQRLSVLAEINQTNRLLKETTNSVKSTLNRLQLLEKQILSRKKIISLLNEETKEVDLEITKIQAEIVKLEKDLKERKAHYAKLLRFLSRGKKYEIDKVLFVFSADNFAQAYRRLRYLKEYASWQVRQADVIIERQKAVKTKHEELKKSRASKANLLLERQKEQNKLLKEEDKQQSTVKDLNKKQTQLRGDLKKQQQQAAALNKQIEQQIAYEIAEANRKRKAEESSKKPTEKRQSETKGGYAMTQKELKLSKNFASNRGRLPYPVSGWHTVVGTFGEQRHAQLKHVRTNSSGINIQAKPGADALASFEGTVSKVFTIPGYNHSIILRHGNYLTVYSNLDKVYVQAGDKVKTQQALGKIFSEKENGNMTVLHFQLWKETVKQNPLPWLR